MKKLSNKNLVATCLVSTAVALSSAEAAVVTIAGDGSKTTIEWTGFVDKTGLFTSNIFSGDVTLATPNFSSVATISNSADILLLNGQSLDIIITHTGWQVSATPGWTDPSGDNATVVTGANTGMFYFNAPNGEAGFFNSGNGSVVLAGTLAENGFTAGETLTFSNPNISANNTITVNTVFVPEPSSLMLSLIGGIRFLTRRRR